MSVTIDLAALDNESDFDVVVVGAGGAGMAAALFAAIEGAKTLVIESTEFVGGTTAYSGGTAWIPDSLHASGVDPQDSVARAEGFLDGCVGNFTQKDLRTSYLVAGPQAIALLESQTHVHYRARFHSPDYLSNVEGASDGGRALEPLPFDGRLLGEDFALIRPPIPELTVLRGMMVGPDDIALLRRPLRSLSALGSVMKLVMGHVRDRFRYTRGTRLVMGNAYVGRLLLSLKDRNVPVLLRTQVAAVTRDSAGVRKIQLASGDTRREIRVRGGLILASGGFNRNPKRRAEILPGVDMDWCPGAPGHRGAMQDMVMELGAHLGQRGRTDCFWTPVSTRKRRDGSIAVFPHFVTDRPKPHMIVVDGSGKRFANEAISWHEFAVAMLERDGGDVAEPVFLITDARGLAKYGLGMVRPAGYSQISAIIDGMGLTAALRDGYVTRGATLRELAEKLGIDPIGLGTTIDRFNGFARSGRDEDFARGETSYERAFGDPEGQGPNPNLGVIERAPFYAVRLFPGDIGAATGLAADREGRLVDGSGSAILGLYACGNEMHSVMGGIYPGPGATIGPGLVFGYLAARDAAARARWAATA